MNYNNLFEFEMTKLIESEIARLSENITNPSTVADFSDYKFQIGKIAGLRSVLELIEEVNRILDER